jgi:hypothetical protein
MSECLNFGYGLTAGTIISLQRRSIPQPDNWTYTPYSRVETTGSGTRKGFGFGTATWQWDTLTQGDINKFLDTIDSDEASATLFISTPTDRGGAAQTFDEFQTIFDRITDGQGKTLIAQTQHPVVYNNVTANFTHLVES